MNREPTTISSAAEQAGYVREQIPSEGLFAGHHWRISPKPFSLHPKQAHELEELGRVLLRFFQGTNLLYRQSVAGKQPKWVADWLDRGKPEVMRDWQQSAAFRQEVPRVIRPDLLLTGAQFSMTELDSVPGGIGMTAWLNQVYSQLGYPVVGGASGMTEGFRSLFGAARRVHVVVSEEARTYRPEMEWLCRALNDGEERFFVRDGDYPDLESGDGVYRFFELFDYANVPNAATIFRKARDRECWLTPPPKPALEEKLLFALLWNGHLQDFWRQHLGSGFLRRLQQLVPYTWVVDPTPLPPHATIPCLELVDWQQLKSLSQKERELILKVSGFSEEAWGSRGVFLGSDLSLADWGAAVDKALSEFSEHPYVLQRFTKPTTVESEWFDFGTQKTVPMVGRVRICPYYFVTGQGDEAQVRLGGVLATICSADKKIIHGMKEAIMAPCMVDTIEGV